MPAGSNVTGSLNRTVMLMVAPVPYVPSLSGDVTPAIRGSTPSIMIAPCASRPAPGRAGSVRFAASPLAAPATVPPLSESARGPA